MTILDEIAEYAVKRVAFKKEQIPYGDMKKMAKECGRGDFLFEKALAKPELSFILECKKASPSKGVIADDYPYLSIAKEYEEAGCDAISTLTEPKWFLGSSDHLKEIAKSVSVPVLRKDFVVDDYMIYEAKYIGASAVLLIVSILSEMQLQEYIGICDELGLSALVEIHDGEEAKTALRAKARVIGVNNRNLRDFSVDTNNAGSLRDLIPKEVLFVSESGVRDVRDVRRLREIGADAVLVGEALMRADDRRAIGGVLGVF